MRWQYPKIAQDLPAQTFKKKARHRTGPAYSIKSTRGAFSLQDAPCALAWEGVGNHAALPFQGKYQPSQRRPYSALPYGASRRLAIALAGLAAIGVSCARETSCPMVSPESAGST